MKKFIENNFTIIVFVVLIILLFKSCNDGRELSRLRNDIIMLKDSTYNKLESNNNIKKIRLEIKLEGLKSEKRMIQSTDRKILDVNRETQIDIEINKLEQILNKQ